MFYLLIVLFTLPSVRSWDQTLQLCGENRMEIERSVSELPGEKQEDIIWILNRLPQGDLTGLSGELISHWIIYPESAQILYSWSQPVDDVIWRNYVLFPRFSQEPLEDYRPWFFRQLGEIVDTCSDLVSAVNTIHNWATEVVKFKPTQRRDQGPLETYAFGYGRCEELMIFNGSACRSFGIPVRQAFAPYWAFTDNNHAWTEVYVDGKWQYIGVSGNTTLNQSWFSDHTKRTSIIVAISPEDTFSSDLLYTNRGISLINSTANYAPTASINIQVIFDSQPVDSATVSFQVFNWGAFREILRLFTDSRGWVRVDLGLTSAWIIACKDNNYGYEIYTPSGSTLESLTIEIQAGLEIDTAVLMLVPPLKND